jgi:molybdopterin converting factor small subunit
VKGANLIVVVKAAHDLARCLGGYRHEIEIERPVALSELMQILVDRYGTALNQWFTGREDSLWKLAIFVNGRNVLTGEGQQTIIKDGDEIFFLSPMSGG